jgi:hypothetical protein
MSKFTRKLTSSVAPVVNTPGVWTVNERTQNSTALVITSIVVCDSGYNELDDTAVGTTGGYLKIKGTGFLSTATVYVNGVLITPTVTSSLELRITVPTLTVGTYSLIVFNTAAVGAIWAPGLVVSGFPVWSTTTIATANLAVSTQLVATGDATLVYTLASGSLPPGVTLSSSGLLSGTISPVPSVDTVYSFTVDVKDAQNQNLAQAITFSLSVFYLIPKSLRFRSSASAYLSRTPATATSQTTWTWSAWVKRGALADGTLFSAGVSSLPYATLAFSSNQLVFDCLNSGPTVVGRKYTNALYRDPAAWYHVVAVWDTTNGTASNRMLLYVNGEQVTSFQYSTDPAPSATTQVNSTVAHSLGQFLSAGSPFDGEMAEVNFVDGRAVPIAELGAYSIYNQWLPKKYAGTYGTNGFYLEPKMSTTSYAGYFNGKSGLTVPNSSALYLGGGPWDIECWIYPTTSAVGYIAADWTSGGAPGPSNWVIYLDGTNIVVYATSTGNYQDLGGVTISTTYSLNAWAHVALTYDGTTLRLFKNGAVSASTAFSGLSTSVGSHTSNIGIGIYAYALTYPFPGYMSNLRIVKGSAVYTSAFTPSTTPLTAITGTALLTLQNATFVSQGATFADNSSNAATLTNINALTVTSQSPFSVSMTSLDSSGNANNWTPNNISLTAGPTYDSLTDVPTLTSATAANYAVLNPLSKVGSTVVIQDNNLTFTKSGATYYNYACATIGISSGKFYWEITQGSTTDLTVGITNSVYADGQNGPGYSAGSYIYMAYNGNKRNNNVLTAYGGTFLTSGYVIGVALDMDIGTLTFYLNGVSQGQAFSNLDGTYFPYVSDQGGQITLAYANFGQRPFSYPTLPTGFLPLNTYNLGTDSSIYFAAPISYLVVAGGGAGSGTSYGSPAGGGGAGGYRTITNVLVPSGVSFAVVVGAGAAGVGGAGNTGTNSSFYKLSSDGGGGGYYYYLYPAGSGGSGGGGGSSGAGGTGNIGGYSPPEGYAGGSSNGSSAGGGGGAGSAGGTGSAGVGLTWLNGTTYAAGGYGSTPGANTGGGGTINGGSGASGVVVIRYADSYVAATSTTGSPTIVVSGGFRTYTFTSSGTITF